MQGREKWIAAAEEMWRPLRVADEEGRTFCMEVCKKNADLVVKTFFEDSEYNANIYRIYGTPAVVVGIDIREWTRRESAVQSFMTANLNKNIRKVLEQLHRGGIIGFCDPINVSYTGDGAIIIFGGPWSENPSLKRIHCTQLQPHKCLDHKNGGDQCIQNKEPFPCDESTIFAALSFVFSFNALMQQDNLGKRFNHTPGTTREHGYTPLHLRYAVSFGPIIPIIDAFDNLQFVGAPLVTCSRILSTDHGNHFLIDAKLLHEMNKYGGISNIGKSKRSTNWDQELLVSELPDRQVKSGFFRYADVVGHHGDGPLLLALGKTTVNPVRYQIGSHDVRAFD
jgi:hypothetical protein